MWARARSVEGLVAVVAAVELANLDLAELVAGGPRQSRYRAADTVDDPGEFTQ